MKVSLTGMLRTAIEDVDSMMEEIRLDAGFRKRIGPDDDMDDDDPAGKFRASRFMLAELLRHAEETMRGEHSIQQFAEFYLLRQEAPSRRRRR